VPKNISADIDSLVEAGIGDCLTVSQLFKAIPYEVVDKALLNTDRSNRRMGSFPDHFVIYFVVLMALFMDHSYEHTMMKLRKALIWLSDHCAELTEVSGEAIVQARQRVTFRPLMALFELIARPLATITTPGAFFYGLRLVAIDGIIFDTEDTPANVVGFGRPKNQKGDGAYPQVRCVAIIEQATRAVIDLAFGSITGTSEHALARQLLARLKSGMLCLADRLYPGFELCQIVMKTGAHFVWRVKSDIKLEPFQLLDDKSYLAKLYAHTKSRRRIKDQFLVVRVVEYTLKGNSEKYRLITSIIDPKQAPARELAKLYPKRWTQETFNAEIKKTLRRPRILLRSKKPEQVIQELYGLFIGHFVVRSFMFEAASVANIPPDVLSFTHSVFVLKSNLSEIGSFSP
jgi:hypothetical protein